MRQANYHKYHAKKAYVDGICFDSKKEARRWQELKLLQKAGAISDLERQKEFVLIPKQVDEHGKVIERACKYRADFVYYEDDQMVVEDVKGIRTDVYKIKKKLMLYVHKIRIRET